MSMLIAMLPTVGLVVTGQLVTKWRIAAITSQTDWIANAGRWERLLTYFVDPYIMGAYLSTFLGSVAWMFVAEKFAISVAFPAYIGITVVSVVLGGVLLLGEAMRGVQILGVGLVVVGVALAAR